ncbi:MAG: elongation factor P maturation arginine rhamnosyltransferase EarP, partial [Candidatus Nitrotoga sp.]
VQPDAPQGDNEIRVSLFCYENAALPALFTEWENSPVPILCLVPEGRVLPQVAAHFKHVEMAVGALATRGNLRVKILPLMEQARYDELLWACDINFVRGEDSLVRALWAGKPCVWHIYPQHDFVHLQKLHALMNLYCTNLEAGAAASVQEFWDSWNAPQGDNEAHNAQHQKNISAAWQNYLKHRLILQQHGYDWTAKLKSNDLVLNLLNFIQNTDRMRALRD